MGYHAFLQGSFQPRDQTHVSCGSCIADGFFTAEPPWKPMCALCAYFYPHSIDEKRRRRWHPTPVLLPGKSHGWRSLVGCSPWGSEESDTTEQLHFHFSLSCIGEEMATHSSVLAWRIPGTGEPDGLPSMGSHRVRHD